MPDVSIRAAQRNYKKALEKGLLKIMSKVGAAITRLPACLVSLACLPAHALDVLPTVTPHRLTSRVCTSGDMLSLSAATYVVIPHNASNPISGDGFYDFILVQRCDGSPSPYERLQICTSERE